MLTSLHIKNFKAWRDTGPLRFAPLTILFGANSVGKSSLGHLLLGLAQTALLTDRRRAFHVGDAHSLIDLGSFQECLHGHDLTAQLAFTLRWRLATAATIRDPLHPDQRYAGEHLELTSVLKADSRGLPQLERFHYRLLDEHHSAQLSAEHGVHTDGQPYLRVEPMKLVMKQDSSWPIEAPEKFYRFSDVTLARYQNADSLSRFALETERLLAGLSYLGPMREPPRRTYSWAGEAVPNVGPRGEHAIPALLAAAQEGRELSRGPRKKKERFDRFIAAWLRDLGVIDSFSVQAVGRGRHEYEVLVRIRKGAPKVKLTDVGFGVSQLVPALVQAFYAPRSSTVWMEQPEVHLHPQLQAELADAFISAVQAHEAGAPRQVQLVIESHSEHFLMRLQRRIAEEVISPDDVAVYFARHAGGSLDLDALRLDRYGNIDNWPENFFGDEMAEIAARTQAAVSRRKRERAERNERG